VRRHRWFDELEKVIRGAALPGPYISAGDLARRGGESAAGLEQVFTFSDPAAAPRGDGTSFGSAFHQVMEQVDLRRPSPEQLAGLAAHAAGRWGIDNRDELIQLAQSTLEHPAYPQGPPGRAASQGAALCLPSLKGSWSRVF